MRDLLGAADMIGSEPTDADCLSELYHENSKQRRSDRGFVERIIATSASPTLYRMMFTSRKRYRPVARASLPMAADCGELGKVIRERRSHRDFDARPLTLQQVTAILNCGIGETAPEDINADRPRSFRSAPSAGALYPLEAYLLAESVDRLAPGLYHYDPADNVLEHVDLAQSLSTIAAATGIDELSSAPAVLILTAIPARSRIKYGERAYRFILIETGHVAQNMLLAAERLGIWACPVGGFIDNEVDALLGIDGVDEISLYIIAFGHPGAPDLDGQSSA